MRASLAILAVMAALAVGAGSALADPPTQFDVGADVPDNWVLDVAHHGTTTYLAGFFDWVGPWTGAATDVSVPGGVAAAGYPRVEGGDVEAVVPDTLGGVYIGGAFTSVDGQTRHGLAHLNAGGGLDPTFHPDVDGRVQTMALGASKLYFGGTFSQVDGQARAHLAAVAPFGGALDASWAPCTDYSSHPVGDLDAEYPFAMAVSGSTVYVGGDFDEVAGNANCSSTVSRSFIAAFNGTTGAPTAWTGDANGEVHALAVNGATLYAGGQFSTIGSNGQQRYRLAALSTADGRASAWNPRPDDYVEALQATASTVYAGGSFRAIGASPVSRNGVAALSATTGNATAFDPGLQSGDAYTDVVALALDNPSSPTRVAIGGIFTSPPGARDLVVADAGTGALVPGFAPQPGGTVQGVAFASASDVVAGGRFVSVGASYRPGVAALDPAGHPTPVFFPGARDARELALSPDGGTLYTTGDSGIQAFSTADGHKLPWAPTVTGSIYRMAVSPDGQTVYLGGQFSHVGGQPRANLAAVSATTGAVTAWRPDPNDVVDALAVSPDGGTVYVGGQFATIGPSVLTRPNLAAVSAASGEATGWTPAPDGSVSALAMGPDGAHVYAAGAFAHIGAAPQRRPGVADLTTSTGNPTPFANGLSSGADGPPGDIVPTADERVVYLAGPFSHYLGGSVPGLVPLDGATGYGLSPWYSGLSAAYAPFSEIAADGDTFWAGGDFSADSDGRPYYAQYTAAPAAGAAPSLSGAPQAGSAVTCRSALWRNAPATLSVAWQLDGQDVGGATGRGFTPPASAVGHALRCRETAANLGGSASSTSAAATVAAAPKGGGGAATLRILSSSARLDAKRRFHVALSGAARARGSIAFTYVTKVKRRKRTATLATASFRLPASGRLTLTVRLSKRSAKVVARARRLRVTAKARAGAATASRALTLMPPKPKPAKKKLRR